MFYGHPYHNIHKRSAAPQKGASRYDRGKQAARGKSGASGKSDYHSGYGHSGYGHSGSGYGHSGHSGYGHSGHSGYGHSGKNHFLERKLRQIFTVILKLKMNMIGRFRKYLLLIHLQLNKNC